MTPSVLCAPDKFRGSATAFEIAAAMADGATRAGWTSEEGALSDGGEGYLEVVAPAGERRQEDVPGPLGTIVRAEWRIYRDSSGRRVAVIEAARACGLTLAGGAPSNRPVAATTAGVGSLLAAAIETGADKVLLGCGGSASTDGGAGALAVLHDRLGPEPLAGIEVVVACDVRATFHEAAELFSPQKGATPKQVRRLAKRLGDLADVLSSESGRDFAALPGSGSAGGLAGGLASAGATLRPGFEVVAEIVGFDEKLARADAVLTGEGRLDAGSFGGKVVGCVLGAARRLPSPPRLLCVAGEVGHRGLMPGLQELATIADLSARFGGERSRREPALLTAIVVEEWLSSPP